jgi:hypothetical protein
LHAATAFDLPEAEQGGYEARVRERYRLPGSDGDRTSPLTLTTYGGAEGRTSLEAGTPPGTGVPHCRMEYALQCVAMMAGI